MAESIKSTLQRRQFYRRNESEIALTSIEEATSHKEKQARPVATIGEIPPVIDALIDNKMFRNKFKALIRRGHLQDLLDLVEVAKTKDKPSRWFATATAKKSWERTIDFLKKLREVERVVQEVTQRIKVPADSIRAVFKAAWKHKQGAVRMAVTAAETGKRHPFGLFCTLALKKPTTQAIG